MDANSTAGIVVVRPQVRDHVQDGDLIPLELPPTRRELAPPATLVKKVDDSRVEHLGRSK
eukprot:6184296-Pleurochrysis_carterae.AAC.2